MESLLDMSTTLNFECSNNTTDCCHSIFIAVILHGCHFRNSHDCQFSRGCMEKSCTLEHRMGNELDISPIAVWPILPFFPTSTIWLKTKNARNRKHFHKRKKRNELNQTENNTSVLVLQRDSPVQFSVLLATGSGHTLSFFFFFVCPDNVVLSIIISSTPLFSSNIYIYRCSVFTLPLWATEQAMLELDVSPL